MKVDAFYNKAEHGLKSSSSNNRHDLAIDVLSYVVKESFLDIGAGDGSFMLRMKNMKPDINVAGLEISSSAVNVALGAGLDMRQCDLNDPRYPCDDNSFDSCFMGELIEHVFSPDHLLREVGRIVKPGGYFFLTTPNMSSWFNRLSLLLGYQPVFTEVSAERNAGHLINLPGMPAGHIRLFTYRALCEVVSRNGWEIEKSIGIGMNPSMHRFSALLRILNKIFCSPSVSSGIGVLARKKLG